MKISSNAILIEKYVFDVIVNDTCIEDFQDVFWGNFEIGAFDCKLWALSCLIKKRTFHNFLKVFYGKPSKRFRPSITDTIVAPKRQNWNWKLLPLCQRHTPLILIFLILASLIQLNEWKMSWNMDTYHSLFSQLNNLPNHFPKKLETPYS